MPATNAIAHSVASGHTRTAMPAATSSPPEIQAAAATSLTLCKASTSTAPATISEMPISQASTVTDSNRLVSSQMPRATRAIPPMTDSHQPLASPSPYSMGRGGGGIGSADDSNPALKSVTAPPLTSV